MKDTSSDCKIVKYKLKAKGTYYVKISRTSKKAIGQYGVCFNYKNKLVLEYGIEIRH